MRGTFFRQLVSSEILSRTMETLFRPDGHIPQAVCIRLRICTLTNAGGDTHVSDFESSTESRGALPAISSSPDTLAIHGAVTGAQ